MPTGTKAPTLAVTYVSRISRLEREGKNNLATTAALWLRRRNLLEIQALRKEYPDLVLEIFGDLPP